jgi:NifU-like protein
MDNDELQGDVTSSCGVPWAYSDIVKEHFFNPRNVLGEAEDFPADGTGVVGSPACGDVMLVAIRVDPATRRIRACRWRTFGCASAIASTSMMSVMATEEGGMTLDRAQRLKPEEIIDRLGGLPDRKYHCSVLGHHALREAVLDYLSHA